MIILRQRRYSEEGSVPITKGQRVGTSLLVGGTTGAYIGGKIGSKIGKKLDKREEARRIEHNKKVLLDNRDTIQQQETNEAEKWKEVYQYNKNRDGDDDFCEYAKNAAISHHKNAELLKEGRLDEYLKDSDDGEYGSGLANVHNKLSEHKDYKKKSYKTKELPASGVGAAIGAGTGAIVLNRAIKKYL